MFESLLPGDLYPPFGGFTRPALHRNIRDTISRVDLVEEAGFHINRPFKQLIVAAEACWPLQDA